MAAEAPDLVVAAPAAAEAPGAEVTATAAEKPAKQMKVRATKAPKAKKSSVPGHPPYFEMIKEALLALNEKTGSSPYAIAKFMEENHKGVLPQNYKKVLAVQLRNFTAKGKLVKVKASFKLSYTGKKVEKKNEEKKPAKELKKPKGVTKRKAPRAAKAAPKPSRAKKTTPKRPKKAVGPKPKQPKSIKSPAKKAKKAAA